MYQNPVRVNQNIIILAALKRKSYYKLLLWSSQILAAWYAPRRIDKMANRHSDHNRNTCSLA
jgi:hypothetical protein